MQDQLLSHFLVSHTDPFCWSVTFPVLAGLTHGLENTSVTAHKPAVPYVSIPYTRLLVATCLLPFCLSFLAALNPQPSVRVHCFLRVLPALGLVPITHPCTPSQIAVKGVS